MSETATETKNPEHQSSSLDAAKLTDLVRVSFYMGQGDFGGQTQLYRWLRARFYPNTPLPENLKVIEDAAAVHIQKYLHGLRRKDVLNHAEVDDMIKVNTGRAFAELKAAWEHPLEDTETLAYTFGKSVIARDWRYLVHQGQRPERNTNQHPKPMHDAHLSHFVHHGIKGATTHVTEYDTMYEESTAAVAARLSEPHEAYDIDEAGFVINNIARELQQVTNAHLSAHPEDQAAVTAYLATAGIQAPEPI